MDLPRSEVPHFSAEDTAEHWFFVWSPWLDVRGICLVPIYGAHRIDAYHVAAGMSLRGVRHAVVMRNGRTVHDPHPSRAGDFATRVERAIERSRGEPKVIDNRA